jgi:hypothetical protein
MIVSSILLLGSPPNSPQMLLQRREDLLANSLPKVLIMQNLVATVCLEGLDTILGSLPIIRRKVIPNVVKPFPRR